MTAQFNLRFASLAAFSVSANTVLFLSNAGKCNARYCVPLRHAQPHPGLCHTHLRRPRQFSVEQMAVQELDFVGDDRIVHRYVVDIEMVDFRGESGHPTLKDETPPDRPPDCPVTRAAAIWRATTDIATAPGVGIERNGATVA